MRSPRSLSLVFLAALALVLAACGGTKTVTRTVTAPRTAQSVVAAPCPPGQSFMGCATPRSPGLRPVTQFAAGCRFPDVSSWQGAVNWQAVRSWQRARGCKPAGIFKLGEFVTDPQAARNAQQTRALGFWRAGYWFLRNTGCTHESGQIAAAARQFGLRIVVLDDEVPEARGYDGCLTPALKRAGLIVDEYASPGAYPGGSRSSNPAWIAAYGPANPPAAPWGGPIVAFQCTDGRFGCVTPIPGLGNVDVSIDLGITRQGVGPQLPLCVHHRMARSKCSSLKRAVASSSRAAASSERAYKARGCPVLAQRVGWFASHVHKSPASKHASRVRALAASRRAYRRQACSVFAGRVKTFTAKAANERNLL